MTLRAVLCGFVLLVSQQAFGLDERLLRGLTLEFQTVAESLWTDGVPLRIRKASGLGVAELVRRIRIRWIEEGSEVREQLQGDWKLLSRLEGPRSEVIQWRGQDENTELLWSSLDMQTGRRVVPQPPVLLPAHCIWGPSIAGEIGQQRWLQQSARCSRSPHDLIEALRVSLHKSGWSVRSGQANTLLLDRPGEQAQVSIVLPGGDALTWLVWVSATTVAEIAP